MLGLVVNDRSNFDCPSLLCNSPEGRSSHLLRDGSLKGRMIYRVQKLIAL